MKNTVLSASLAMIILLTANADAESIASMTSGNECRDITFATMQQHVPIPPAAILSKKSGQWHLRSDFGHQRSVRAGLCRKRIRYCRRDVSGPETNYPDPDVMG